MNTAQCEQRLLEGARKLDAVLQPLGFVFRITDGGISSPGPYAVGYYKNGNKNISLIYRSMGLGGIEYSYHRAGYKYSEAGTVHSRLMRYLGKQDFCKVKYDEKNFSSRSREGGNVFDALAYDIKNFAVEFLSSDDDHFINTLNEARAIPEPPFEPYKTSAIENLQLVVVGLILVLICLIIAYAFIGEVLRFLR